jgi:putative endopeptidase
MVNEMSLKLFLSVLFLGPLALAQKKIEPSSEIPERRVFELDQDINPCNDFHKYVCGKVESQFKLREDRSGHTFSFSDSNERILEKKKDFFKNIDSEKNLPARTLQLKSYYKACMNETEAIKEEKALVEELKTTLSKIKTNTDYINLNKQNLTNDQWTFLGFDISPNIDNPKVYDVSFDLGFMFLPEHSYYEDAALTKAYAQLITDFFTTVYPDGNKEDFLKRSQAIIDFEKKFIKTYPLPTDFRKRYTEPRYVSRKDFFKTSDKIGLESFFNKYVPAKTLVRDFIPESFAFVQNEITKPENLQVLKDIYFFRSARQFMDDAYPELYKKRMKFSFDFLGGSPNRPDRQERCTGAVMGAFGKELDQELLGRMFKNFPEEKMVEVTTRIRKSILQGIEKNTWLSAESKKGALEKIETATLQIIKPKTAEEWDFKPIQKYSETRPYENGKKLSQLSQKRTFERLRNGVNVKAWGMSPLTVNAYYSPDKNKFVMPIGILQYPFFVPEGDVIENLGAVGAVVGHELGHSIDDEGSKFNAKGQLKQWMSDEDIKKFKERGQKMVNQFNKIGHNGELTLGENVADLVGLTFAYQAAFPDLTKKTVEDEKKFYVAYARLWCEVDREKSREAQLKTDPHSLGYARINEQVKHQPGFQKAYNCKSGHKLFLEPKDQIQIW